MRNRTLSVPGADSEARRVPRVRVICTQARPGADSGTLVMLRLGRQGGRMWCCHWLCVCCLFACCAHSAVHAPNSLRRLHRIPDRRRS